MHTRMLQIVLMLHFFFTLGSRKDFEELLQLTNGKPREIGNDSVSRDSK